MANNTMKNHALLSAALEGLQLQKARIEEQIQEVRAMLGQKVTQAPVRAASKDDDTGSGAGPKKRRKKRRLSAEARARIAAAQKKRWTEYRKKKSGE